ncbi:MAG: hypothetical protein HKN46_03995 [Acidimicrobiia bacterium]|nr:hypothetical protein [Acidimicrobiia bacterium]
MRPRSTRVVLALALVVGAAACTIEVPTVTGPTFDLSHETTVAGPIDIDLRDDALMARLGVDSPAEIRWLRPLDGVDLVGVTPEIEPGEHELLINALAELPPQLDVRPRLIIRSDRPPTAEFSDPFAVARGPDVWLFDATFEWDGAGVNRFTMARVLAHEFAHIAQFEALDPVVVGDVAARRSSDLSLTNSLLLQDFIAATGWERDGEEWQLDGAASSEYGATNPIEDMAEAVSLIVAGLGDGVPGPQAAWVEAWLGVPADVLAEGAPWAPADAIEIVSGTPLFDEARVARLAGDGPIEVLSYQLTGDAPDGPSLAALVGERLGDRKVIGALGRVDDPAVMRFAGRFDRPDGSILWVEVWDFREAPGYENVPDAPVLSYVLIDRA